MTHPQARDDVCIQRNSAAIIGVQKRELMVAGAAFLAPLATDFHVQLD